MFSLLFLALGVRASLITDCHLKEDLCTKRGCLWCPDTTQNYCSETCGGAYTTETGPLGALVGFESTLQYVNSVEVTWTSIPGDATSVTVSSQALKEQNGVYVVDPDKRPLTQTLKIGQKEGTRLSGAPAPTIQTVDSLFPDSYYNFTVWATNAENDMGPATTITVKTKKLNSEVFPGLIGSWTSTCTNATGAPGTRLEFTFTEAKYSASWEYFYDPLCQIRAAEFNIGGDYFVDKADPEKDKEYGIFEFQPAGAPPTGLLSLYALPDGETWPPIVKTLIDEPLMDDLLFAGGQYSIFNVFCSDGGKQFVGYTESKTSVSFMNINDPSCSLYALATASFEDDDGFHLESDSALVDYVMSEADEEEAEERGKEECEKATSSSITGKTLGLTNAQASKDLDVVTAFMVVFLLSTIGLSIALAVTCRKKNKGSHGDAMLNDYSEM